MSAMTDVFGNIVGTTNAPGSLAVNTQAFSDPTLQANQAKLTALEGQVQQPTTSAQNTAQLVATEQGQIAGTTPSVAQTTLAQQTQQNQQAAMGMAASAPPGVNPALALRTAMTTGANATQTAAGQAAITQAGETAAATQNLNTTVQSQAQQQQTQQALVQQYVSMGLSLDEAQFQAQQSMAQTQASVAMGVSGLDLQAQESNQGANTNLLGGLAAGAGVAALAFMAEGGPVGKPAYSEKSDRRLKMKVRPADKDDIGEMLKGYKLGGPVHTGHPILKRLPMPNTPHDMPRLAAGGPIGAAGSIPGIANYGAAPAGAMSDPNTIIAQALANTKPAPAGNIGSCAMQGAQLGSALGKKYGGPGNTVPGGGGMTYAQGLAGGVEPMAEGGPVGKPAYSEKKVGAVMHEFGKGKLHSGSARGPEVTDPKQAVAIAISEAKKNRKASGGPIAGPGGPRDDEVPAMLSNGENVLSAHDVRNMGGQDNVEQVKDMLDQLHAKKFAYKGEGPEAEHTGILAQDLEKSRLGKTMVLDTPRGKAVQTNMILPALLAAAAELHQRVNHLEAHRG